MPHPSSPTFAETSKTCLNQISNQDRPPSKEAQWLATVQEVVRAVVSIHFCHTYTFDTSFASAGQATGFVVDTTKGIILTNRHVVGAGPFWGYGIFHNHEEVRLYPVYRDPVHDYAFLRYDPKAIKYMPIVALQLRPNLARVGVEIKILGNDAGEKLSIMSSAISRLDRNAPEYGNGYNDFNTNYIQAAAGAVGGSSGSPVINIDGHAIALQAGNKANAATDYFFPLFRPLRALKCLQRELPITRGTIQCKWVLEPFNKCQRLGLTSDWEAYIRTSLPAETGLLVAKRVVPDGPSDQKIQEGDILLKVNDTMLTQFVALEEILDSSVDTKISLHLHRGGKDITVEIDVSDLHDITPDRFVTCSGAVFHDLSYQQAMVWGTACKGVFMWDDTGSFYLGGSSSGFVIEDIHGQETPDLTTFIDVLKNIPDRSRVGIKYKELCELHTSTTSTILVDRHWYKEMRMAIRNDITGLWDFTDLADPIPAVSTVHRSNISLCELPPENPLRDAMDCLVWVDSYMPLLFDGIKEHRIYGIGIVVNWKERLVIVSRAVVPVDLCDILITIKGTVIAAGKVVFLHPYQNYAIVQYEPSLSSSPRDVSLSETPGHKDADLQFVGFGYKSGKVVEHIRIADIVPESIPDSFPPHYRACNVELLLVNKKLCTQHGGVLVEKNGTVKGVLFPFLFTTTSVLYGLDASIFLSVLDKVGQGITPRLCVLDAEFKVITLWAARTMGVPEEWLDKITANNVTYHPLFQVRRASKWSALMAGDIILSLNGKIVTRFWDLDAMHDHDVLDAVVVRQYTEMVVRVKTTAADDLETSRVVSFCGATIQKPHYAVRQQVHEICSEVYVSSRSPGSPAEQYKLRPGTFITAVNNVSTPNLDSFLNAILEIPDNTGKTPFVMHPVERNLTSKQISYLDSALAMTLRTFVRCGKMNITFRSMNGARIAKATGKGNT